ncbi:MAG: nucleoside-diphosphate kinase [Candidatus Kapabacteria bacterium]|jgi:nucleoside-diphosphate kinase|nr:nucleoside-diphosphate kinase [Candidatus Kapabacteria bacterium]
MKNKTLAIIKPDAVSNKVSGAIIEKIQSAGFKVLGMKLTKITPEIAAEFYAVHRERPFYNDLISYMTSGAIVPLALEKDNAVEEFRNLIGATDPKKAEQGTIRALFGSSIEANAIHGSDSDENAIREIAFFFSESELVMINS